VHLVRNEQSGPDYAALSPQRLVPLLQDGETRVSQSMAIIEYLDELYPTPPLLPADALGRARVRALAQTVACDTHPLNNLRVLKYLVRELKTSEEAKNTWYRHWCSEGLQALERQLQGSGPFCYGASPTLADCCLVPQVSNAQRFEVSLEAMPRVRAIYETCMAHPAFQAADPARCPDAE
jgi:maleylacetoacetate isomerase/maleylpyruvate isomerase